jgi:trehalose 6-phosphate phosphatase
MIPSALDHVREIAAHRGGLAVFLDYDGTLTPIVSDPEKALLSDSMRQTLRALAARAPVAILSGRDLDDICQRVDIGTVVYGGSHGFDIAGPRGLRKQVAAEFLAAMDTAENELRKMLACIPGTLVERKRFSVAAHYRNVDESDVAQVERIVNQVAAHRRKLRKIDNKKVYELQPDIDWDKGKAVLWLLEALGLEQDDVRPVYIGDDRTDEDAFRALEQRGAGILVGEQPRPTAARYSLKNTAEVQHFLRALISSLT